MRFDKTSPTISPWVLLSLTNKALENVSTELKQRVEDAILKKRAKSAESRPLKSRKRSRQTQRFAAPIVRKLIVPEHFHRRVAFSCSEDPRDIGFTASMLLPHYKPINGLVRPHSTPVGVSVGNRSQSVMNRLSLKLMARGKIPFSTGKLPVVTPPSDKPVLIREDLDNVISDLRMKAREAKVSEARQIRNNTYNPKQILTEFARVGASVRRKLRRPQTSPDSSTKELGRLIEIVDARLSTSSAMAILKKIGIDHVPRTEAGRKNIMATGLSAALGTNGLRLSSHPEGCSEEVEIDGMT